MVAILILLIASISASGIPLSPLGLDFSLVAQDFVGAATCLKGVPLFIWSRRHSFVLIVPPDACCFVLECSVVG